MIEKKKKTVLCELRPHEMAPLSIWCIYVSLSSMRDSHVLSLFSSLLEKLSFVKLPGNPWLPGHDWETLKGQLELLSVCGGGPPMHWGMIDGTFDFYSLDSSHTHVIRNASRHHPVFFVTKVIPKENNYSRTVWVLRIVRWGWGWGSHCLDFQVFPLGQARFLRKGSSSPLPGGQRPGCQWSDD